MSYAPTLAITFQTEDGPVQSIKQADVLYAPESKDQHVTVLGLSLQRQPLVW